MPVPIAKWPLIGIGTSFKVTFNNLVIGAKILADTDEKLSTLSVSATSGYKIFQAYIVSNIEMKGIIPFISMVSNIITLFLCTLICCNLSWKSS